MKQNTKGPKFAKVVIRLKDAMDCQLKRQITISFLIQEQNFRQTIRLSCSRMMDTVNLRLRKDERIVVHRGKQRRM